MQFKQLLTDEDAVSPVIGVILMVAITVILAAVIGTFVLGLGENVQDSAPQANFQFEYSNNGDNVVITHTGGEDVNPANVEIQGVDGGPLAGTDGSAFGASTISTGSSTGTLTVASGEDTIRVVWTSPSGGNSNTIGQSSVPS